MHRSNGEGPMTDDDVDARIEALETRLAYQDRTIEDLDKAVTTQWSEIETLRREVKRLTERLQQAEDRSTGPQVPDPPPPHY
jgi:SlyX protein